MRRDGSRKGGRKRTAVTVVTVLPTADGGGGPQRSAGRSLPGPQCPHPLHGQDEAWRVGGAAGISEEDRGAQDLPHGKLSELSQL